MISDIYIMSFTLQMNYYDEQPFNEVLVKEVPKYTESHLPRGATFKSIKYSEDELVTAFMENTVESWLENIDEMKKKGIQTNVGVYKIQLEGEKDFTRIPLVGIEYLFQEIHKEFSFIGSLFLYLLDDEFQIYARLHTFETDEDDSDDIDIKEVDDFAGLFYDYFYECKIPDYYADEVAKWFLLKGRL